jgi:hypothetical protein
MLVDRCGVDDTAASIASRSTRVRRHSEIARCGMAFCTGGRVQQSLDGVADQQGEAEAGQQPTARRVRLFAGSRCTSSRLFSRLNASSTCQRSRQAFSPSAAGTPLGSKVRSMTNPAACTLIGCNALAARRLPWLRRTLSLALPSERNHARRWTGTCQTSSQYSRMARSEENQPTLAVFRALERHQAGLSRQRVATSRWRWA